MSKKILFNDNWEFTRLENGSNLRNIQKDDIVWERVDLPHDWLIKDTDTFYRSCDGWYRKYVTLDNIDGLSMVKGIDPCTVKGIRKVEEEQARDLYLLRFEGIYMDSTVYVNGSKAGEWKYGYTTFELDITDYLRVGQNEILVHVVYQTPNSRWYSGAGIYRNVWLRKVPQLHFASDGIYIATSKTDDNWLVEISCEIMDNLGTEKSLLVHDQSNNYNKNHKEIDYQIRHTIYDTKGEVIAKSFGEATEQRILVTYPQRWDIQEPTLYRLKSELLMEGVVIDEEMNQFGFRTLRFDSEKGFYLNDQRVKLHGVCQHHDLGALGAAVNKTAIKRQLMLLQEMGVNAIRTAHNMCAVELLELADEMGILIVNEAFDMWEKPKNQYDYAHFFKDWAERDVANWIRRDRNHPCIILWSIGNEIYDTHAGERGQEITRYLMEQVYLHDPKKNASVTIGSNYMPWENAQHCGDIVKLVGYNYGEKYYDQHHKQHQDWVIYGSETGSVVQSRGVYHFPLAAGILCDDDEQCSSLGNSITSWGARSIEKCITDDRNADYSMGMFLWSGFDYIGEPTPYHTKNCYFGQLDTAGFKKDSFYIYQAEWTDYHLAPMIHIFPYWDFNEGQLIDVRVCSNAPKIELFYNQVSQGTFAIDHKEGHKLLGDWQIPYHPGELRAVAYDVQNNIIAQDIQRSFGEPAKIILKPDKQKLKADGQDLIFAWIGMEDDAGNPVANANNRVSVRVTGSGRLIGLDNGDSTDYESYKGTSRRLFSGKLLAIIAATTNSGTIEMEVTSTGLPPAHIELISEDSRTEPIGISCMEENKESYDITEIPIRKLEITSPNGTNLKDNLRELEVEVQIHPHNATYQDITWRVTNANGVDTNIAKIQPKGKRVILQAIGDGLIYLRATTNNGGPKPRLISVLEFHITGLGTAYHNPYHFISGSQYSRSIGEISNGNERGVATSRDGVSILIYDSLDFGSIGSDELMIPIFELDSKPSNIEIWEGVPEEEGSVMLGDFIYHKKTIWNTYQAEFFRLNKRLTGITTLAFLLRSKIHMKGFSFIQKEKAYEQLSVLAYDTIYGDGYIIEENSITDIGNNVTIAFEHMDFGTLGCKRIVLRGRCLIDNSILVCFRGDEGEVKQLLEFKATTEYTEREFMLKHITGLQRVEFIFLPGCRFDFQWFHFMNL